MLPAAVVRCSTRLEQPAATQLFDQSTRLGGRNADLGGKPRLADAVRGGAAGPKHGKLSRRQFAPGGKLLDRATESSGAAFDGVDERNQPARRFVGGPGVFGAGNRIRRHAAAILAWSYGEPFNGPNDSAVNIFGRGPFGLERLCRSCGPKTLNSEPRGESQRHAA